MQEFNEYVQFFGVAYLCSISHNCSRFITVVVRSEVFTAVTMKNAVFLDVAPCDSCVNLDVRP
jgi:hypothetical protein